MNEAFQALGDPTRREILRLLRQGDLTAGEISEHFDLAKSTLSGHFLVLRHAGLIVAEKSGTTITYSLNTSVVESLLGSVLDLLGTSAKHPSKTSKKISRKMQ
jgi:ArsR family transcriptional regulator, arsenate/arsenite/antimonite-responsive transcriptional repressor